MDGVPLPPPETDIGRVLRLLQRRGVTIPVRAAVQRFVYLLDQAMRNELLILYGEEVRGSGTWSGGLGADGEALRERALRSFALRFTDSGAP